MRAAVVAVLIDLPAYHRYHRATLAALVHAAKDLDIPIDVQVVPTDSIRDASQMVAATSAVIIGPGSPYRNPDAAHAVVREARERHIPLVGT